MLTTQIIQRQVPIGSRVTFSLKNGKEISGTLIEIGRDHVTVESEEGSATVLIDMIGAWQTLGDSPTPAKKVAKANGFKGKEISEEPEVLKRLLEIEASFQAKTQAAKIEAISPDFIFPGEEFKGKQKTEAVKIWNGIKSRYENAAKINELSVKFGRIQPIINDLKTLANWFPTSTSVKRHLAYFYLLFGNQREAMKNYQEAAVISHDVWDWYNMAAVAMKGGREESACYGLEQFFHRVQIHEQPDPWYLYVRLLKKFSNYSALVALCGIKRVDSSTEEGKLLLGTAIYLLKLNNHEGTAKEVVQKWLIGQPFNPLIMEGLKQLSDQPSETYQKVVSEVDKAVDKAKEEYEESRHKEEQRQPQGYIFKFRSDRNFGFLHDMDEEQYFFHRSAIIDDDLLEKLSNLTPKDQIPVIFEKAEGPKGAVAIRISLFRSIDQMFDLALKYANEGEYSKAISQVKKVLDINPQYPTAKEYYEKWREYARVSSVPRGSNPFARAKRAQLIEKNTDTAAELFRKAINQGDSTESAVKDLVALLGQQGKPQEAIDVLIKNRKKIMDQQSVDNLLVGFYQTIRQYSKAIDILNNRAGKAQSKVEKARILGQIGNINLRQESYIEAERIFREVLQLQPDNKIAQRNIAMCLFKQNHYNDAERVLTEILYTSPDAQASELLEAITQAKATGRTTQIDEIIIGASLSDFSMEISGLTRFFLDRCDFKGIPPDRIKEDEQGLRVYRGSRRDARYDVDRLEDFARQLGTRRPLERADYYLTAGKIEEKENPNQFYQYLCRSFASRGDAFVIENRPVDAARELYCEALSIYDGYRNPAREEDKYDEQDAVNALARFLYSYLGRDRIPTSPPKRDEFGSVLKQQLQYIDNAVEEVVTKHPQREKIFDAISYLVFRSRYAANRILNCLHAKSSLQAMALEYLRSIGISVYSPMERLQDFVNLWNKLGGKMIEEIRSISNDLRFFAKVELTTASLELAIERAKGFPHQLLFELNQQRVAQVQRILEMALDLCKQATFEEQERLCIQIDTRCQDLSREIENSPTKLSIEELHPVIKAIQKKINASLQELYQSSTPRLSLRLPVESYTPDNNRQIEVQIVVDNRIGCSPAEGLELIVQEDEDFFILNVPEVKLDGSLRGGDQRILRVPIHVTEKAWNSQTFSLPVYVQYRMRSEEVAQTSVDNFSIRLYSEGEFDEIENPYATYAEGGVVGDPGMFYGRQELIQSAARAIQESRTQSKCIVIFGQKRAGKSSILHHLKTRLQVGKDLLILDLGNIGSILDEHSSAPLLYQILWSILKKLEYAIEDRMNEGYVCLGLSFPGDREFYKHPSPLILFKDIFERYKRNASKLEDWRNVRLVLLIDEFSYIYGQIVAGHIPELFMKNWKALLQENYFSAVLVGQDVMPKFKQRFPNEFGTTQDERVSYLKREDAMKLMDEPIRIGGRQGTSRYRERAADRVSDLTAGSPFYIQILCNRLVEYMNRKRAALVTEADVEQVKNELLQGVNALGLDKFDNLINSGDASDEAISDEDALNVLRAIALNSRTGPCNRNSIACETHTPNPA